MAVPRKLRELVIERALGYCEYCLCPHDHSPASFSVEHIVPESQGGVTEPENLAWSCQGCNNHKYIHTTGIDPVTGKEVSLFNPRVETWHNHFRWDISLTKLIGISESGRATIARMKLNRAHVINLRRALGAIRKHPPKHLNWILGSN